MNTPLRRLTMVTFVMFIVLMLGTTWVQFVQAASLNSDPRNVRTLYREYGNFRGSILVEGTAVAYSEPIDDPYGYQRYYLNGELYAPVTGYYSVVYGRSSIERWMNTALNGTGDSQFFNRINDLITGRVPQGASVELTINAAAQEAAWNALGDQTGAAVALDPKTGAILAMVSKPSYDPNILASHVNSEVIDAWNTLISDPTRPMENRTISGYTYPPGSVFKLITAAAAIESLNLTPDSVIPAPQQLPLPQSSSVLNNYGLRPCDPSGEQSLADALRVSCNTAFGQLGLDLGAQALADMATKFGFGTTINIPMTVSPSVFPKDPDAPQTALSAIGQFDVRVTPLQVAMMTAAIANEGKIYTPYLVKRVINSSLQPLETTAPNLLGTAIKPQTAEMLTQMMVGVVENGSGTAAKIPGVSVAGKTGTAETISGVPPHAWFTAFAPADDPQVVVAVIVENGGDVGSEATGGRIAAPIAAAIIKAVLE